jgi:hypothetical protein
MDETFQFSEFIVEPPLELERDSQGLRLRISKTDIPYAKLTSRSNTAYSWTEQSYDANGTAANAVPANSGNTTLMPAYELSGSTSIPANSSVVVPLWLGPTGQYFLFSAPASSSGGGGDTLYTALSNVSVSAVVCEENGSITVTLNTTTFQFRANPP